jgi:hypothetical protein
MRTKQDWPKVITDYHSSGKSKVAFCKENNISYQSFLMHLKRSMTSEPQGFRQVWVGGNESSQRVEFHFTDGRCVCFPVDTPKDVIRFLLSL